MDFVGYMKLEQVTTAHTVHIWKTSLTRYCVGLSGAQLPFAIGQSPARFESPKFWRHESKDPK